MRPYDTPEWRRLRAHVLAEEPFCVGWDATRSVHGVERVRTTQVDHIVPLTQGGPTVRSNLRALCRACNAAKSKFDRRDNWRKFR